MSAPKVRLYYGAVFVMFYSYDLRLSPKIGVVMKFLFTWASDLRSVSLPHRDSLPFVVVVISDKLSSTLDIFFILSGPKFRPT